MHNKNFPPNSVILCADVTALYPNLPITLGIATVQKVIKDLNFFTPENLFSSVGSSPISIVPLTTPLTYN